MAKPLLSIICITYNHEKFITQTLDGFLMQQTDFLIEIIIHDDASTDKTASIIRHYEKENQNKKITFITQLETENQYSKGTYEFINDMLRLAHGKYLAFCEGDDYWTDPEKLQRQVDFLEKKPDYALCFHPVTVMVEDGSQPSYPYPDPKESSTFTRDELVKRNYIQTNSVLYRKPAYEDMPNDIMPHDWYLHLYHAQFGKIGFINRTMAVYRRHAGGVWADSHNDPDKMWLKQGLKWLGFHVAVLKLYDTIPEYRTIIEGSIITLYNTLARIDETHKTDLITQSVAAYPASAGIYIEDLRKAVAGLKNHSDEQALIMERLQLRVERLEAENRHLKSKLLLRLKGAVRRRVRRINTKSAK